MSKKYEQYWVVYTRKGPLTKHQTRQDAEALARRINQEGGNAWIEVEHH